MNFTPAGWSQATLADIARWGSGGTPRAGDPRYYGGDIPWAVIGDLNDGVVVQTKTTITQAGLRESAAKIVPEGAVLVAMYGSIGKLGVAGRTLSTNQAIAFAVSGPRILSKYLFYYLLSQRRKLDAAGKGATQRNISQTVLKAWPIRFPDDLGEQERIVDILEDHLSRLDAGGAGIRKAEMLAKSLRVAAMTSAVDGVSALESSDTTTHALQFGGSRMTLPSTWTAGTVGQVASLVEYGTSARAHSDPQSGDVPVLRMGNIRDARLDWTSLKYLPSTHDELPRLLLRKGDLLFNRTNSAELVGKSAIFQEDATATFASYLIRARFNDAVNPHWVNMVINSAWGRAYISSVVSQQVGQANVNGTKLKAFPLPVPPVDEQLRRIELFSSYANASQRLSDQVGRGSKRLDALRRALLIAAFTGRLTGRTSDVDVVEEMADV